MLDELSFTNLDSRKNRESRGNSLFGLFNFVNLYLFFFFSFLVNVLNEDPLQQLHFLN